MRATVTGMKSWVLSTALLLSCPILANNAQAAQSGHPHTLRAATWHHVQRVSTHLSFASSPRFAHAAHLASRGIMQSHGISCVPYARSVSGIMVTGNAWQWWYNAQGVYARGDLPETGSVLNFRANGRMHLGHVAVVTQIVNPREVIVDHANWPGVGGMGGISRGVAVVDVSEANDWSAVRVELGRGSEFGSVYPTYGFIYNRPDTGLVTASVERPAPQPAINPVPSDLRPAAERPWRTMEEVAEAPAGMPRRIDLRVGSIGP